MDQKEEQWRAMVRRYNETDEGVREAVVVLNLLGINTIASCGGHIDHGVAAPWIDICVENNEELAQWNKEADELETAAEELFRNMTNQHEARRLMAEYEVIKEKIMEANLQEVVDVERFLQEFYEGRKVLYRTRIVINIYGRGYGRLISQGGLYQEAYKMEERVRFLKEYQQEMQSFGEWLKKKWFGS